jgi:hypothetical protein
MRQRLLERFSFTAPAGGLLLLALLSPPALAATPRIVGKPSVSVPSFNGTPNTMMYDVTVQVDGTGADTLHQAVVGFIADDDYTTCAGTTGWKFASPQTFDTSDTRTWSLYNFIPGTAYRYKVEVGRPGGLIRSKCGVLRTAAVPTPTLPTELGRLNLQYTFAGASHPSDTDYVILETDDCAAGTTSAKYYVIGVDPQAETIVWYLDIQAMTGLTRAAGSSFRYEAGVTPAEDRILMNINQRYLYEWYFDGTESRLWDFSPSHECDGRTGSEGPCVHHDVNTSDATGDTYVLSTRPSDVDVTGTEWEDDCGAASRFLDDGFRVLDSSWNVVNEYYIISDLGYDPATDGGPLAAVMSGRRGECSNSNWDQTFDPIYDIIDWTHQNSIAASSFGSDEVVDMSFRDWNQVIRVDAATGDVLWHLSSDPAYSDFDFSKAAGIAGRPDFAGQHAVHAVAEDRLLMMDNKGNVTDSRALEVSIDTDTFEARIEKSWAIVDDAGSALTCPIEGSAEQIPGTTSDHVLTLCNGAHAVIELDDPSGGTGEPPPLFIELPNGHGAEPICTVGGPTSINDFHGWHKAFPAASIGEF